jgi:hypothetical protein
MSLRGVNDDGARFGVKGESTIPPDLGHLREAGLMGTSQSGVGVFGSASIGVQGACSDGTGVSGHSVSGHGDLSPPKDGSKVFISYSRKDKGFVAKLDKALKAYKPPKGLNLEQRNLDVFLDTEDFTGNDYKESVARHLNNSGKLLLVCSPNARRSSYVNDEVKVFAEAKGAKNIVPLLISGLPNNEAKPGHEDEMAFPEALCAVMQMPLAADYRHFDPRKDRMDRGIFYGAWFTTLANIYGISRGEIEQRDKKRRANRRKVTIGIISGVILALSAALAYALFSRAEAVRQRREVEKAGSKSEYLRGCELIASGDEDKALSTLAHALELSAGNREAATRLINLLGQRSWPCLITTLQHAQAVERLAATPGGRRLFVAVGKRYSRTDDGLSAVHAWDLDSLRLIAPPQVDPRYMAPFEKLTVNASGDRVMAFRDLKWRKSGSRSLELFDADSGRMMARWDDSSYSKLVNCFFSNDGNSILYWSSVLEREAVRTVSAANGNPVRTIPLEPTSVVMVELIGERIYILDEHGRLISGSLKRDPPYSAYNLNSTSEGKVDKCSWARVSPDKQSLYGLFESNSGDDSAWYIGRWRLADGKDEHVWGHPGNRLDLNNVDEWDATFDATGKLTLVGKDRLRGSHVVLRTSGETDLIEDKLPWQSISLLSPRLFLAANGKAARIILRQVGRFPGRCATTRRLRPFVRSKTTALQPELLTARSGSGSSFHLLSVCSK